MREPTANQSAPLLFAIDDNPADIRLVEEGVAAADIEVDLRVLNSGRRAADQLKTIDADSPEEHPDLILVDLNLPGTSGFELLETVRNESVFQHVPVVIISSSENPDDISRSYELSANAYVTKPSDPDEYITMINRTIDFWITAASTQTNE